MATEKLSTLSGRPVIREYAQGRAQDATGEIAEFLAPAVEVSTMTGKYKTYDEETRFKLPETLRSLGGKATVVEFDRDDADFNVKPHALDTPLDDIEIEEAEGEDLLMETSDDIAALAGMAHENRVITTGVGALSAVAGKGAWSQAQTDPVAEINAQIVDVIKAAGAGSVMEVGILLDPNAMIKFFANKNVKGYFPGISHIAPTIENMKKLFLGKVESKVSFLAVDTAAAGKDKDMNFVLADKVLVFARSSSPTRRDPSFMKTFRRRGRWMVPGSYRREDDRGETIKFDWTEQVVLTNVPAARLLEIE
jgi:hypothetical protein